MDAVVLIGCSTRLNESVAILRQRGMPMVAVEAPHMDGVVAIDLRNHDASASIAQHLRDFGHTRVAVVTLPLEQSHLAGPLMPDWRDRATAEVSIQRLLGVGAVYDSFDGYVASASSIEAGIQAGIAVLDGPERPTAVIAQSDLLAIGVIRAAEQLALRVPGDVSVVGFDGAHIESGYDLTTMIQPAVEKGRAAGRAIVAMLAGEEPKPVTFDTVFHVGDTTGPAPR
jgi:DNA-binding LacI/PurR family transcriptional regulator